MSASYSFLPWVRLGLANQIAGGAGGRAFVRVTLGLRVKALDGTTINQPLPAKTVQLYGPGDVIGLDTRTIIRTDPHDAGASNFEPNYLAAIDFYDEDLPWRYTPVAPDAQGRLLPWILLIVLKEGEFTGPVSGDARQHLPATITVTDDALAHAFPDAATLWAWAHVQVNGELTASGAEVVATDTDAAAARLSATLAQDADLAYSRIVSPRRLEPNTGYTGFLLPAFESGRRAGLGLDPAGAGATDCAWTSNGPQKSTFPVYFSWQFRTGTVGDFESLVRLLQPKPVDHTVGVRDVDVQKPGADLPGITDPALGGALALADKQDPWAQPYPHPFQKELASFINLADAYDAQPAATANDAAGLASLAGRSDPVITPPLYGRWHARISRLLTDAAGAGLSNAGNWVHELNLDPRYRLAAGFGARVVQGQQEDLMASAWQQVGAVLQANSLVRRLAFAQKATSAWMEKHVRPMGAANAGQALALTAPLHARVMITQSGGGAITVRAKIASSVVPPVYFSPAMRRIVRPRGRIMRSLPFTAARPLGALLDRVNRSEITAAPAKIMPRGAMTVEDLATAALPQHAPPWLVTLLRNQPEVTYAPLTLAALVAIVAAALGLVALAGLAVVAGAAVTAALMPLHRSIARADTLREATQTRAAVDALPHSADFTFIEPGAAAAAVTLSRLGTDGANTVRFKSALKDVDGLLEASAAADAVGENGPLRASLDLAGEAGAVLRAIDPAVTMARRARALVQIPARLRAEVPDDMAEVMAYPVFDIPMYRPLADLSAELFLPNLNRIPNNCITLLEANQKFIEAYMVGLNHEFARELLWREYPTDQRGSYFRQFWDVSTVLAREVAAGEDEAKARDQLRDILPLHRWTLTSRLGDHDARALASQGNPLVILAVRGELLRRYPNAKIYAQAAKWTLTRGVIDLTRPRQLVDVAEADFANPPPDKLRMPLFFSKVEPDITFFGFNLDAATARGGSGRNPSDPAGWFFVISEQVGEPRFGFEETSPVNVAVWNDLGWDRAPLSDQSPKFIKALPAAEIVVQGSASADEIDQNAEDTRVRWNSDVGAAELAYILYRSPVLVAVHAGELLGAG
jgi:hypothetical protein